MFSAGPSEAEKEKDKDKEENLIPWKKIKS